MLIFIAFTAMGSMIQYDTDSDGLVDQYSLETGNDSTITKATLAAAEDLTISLTGATNSSIILSSAGTGTDAISLIASAGGISFTTADDLSFAVTGAAGEDLLLTNTGGSIVLTATEAVADAIVLNASTALGGIDITSNADIDITTTGAAGEDITLTNTGGSVNINATEAAAGQVAIAASGTVAGNAVTVTTTDGGIQLTAGGASNGDIGITAGDDMTLTSTGTLTLTGASSVVFTNGQTRMVNYYPNDFTLDGTAPPTLIEYGTDGQAQVGALSFDADGGSTGDDLAFINWVVPDGYIADSARLNVYYTFSTAEDAADEAQFDFAVNAVAAGEAVDAAGTALADQATVIADASADNGKVHVTQYNIEVEDIAVNDLVTILVSVDESASALANSGTLDVLYAQIEYESTE